MKKKGSALTTALIVITALLILGTAIATAVVNTTKFNAKYSENIDLELAAKSGLNITRDEVINEINRIDKQSDISSTEREKRLKAIATNILLDENQQVSDYESIPTLEEEGITVGRQINLIIEENAYKYILVSKATDKNNIYKEEKQIINVAIKADEDLGGEEPSDLLPLLEMKLSGIFDNAECLQTNGNQRYQFIQVFFKYNENESSSFPYYKGKNIKYDEYIVENNRVIKSVANQSGPIDVEYSFSIPTLDLSGSEKTGTTYIGSGNSRFILDTNGKYQLIDNYKNYTVFLCNGDVTIEPDFEYYFNYNKKTVFIVNGTITFKHNKDKSMNLSNIALVANEIKTDAVFQVIKMNGTLTITRRLRMKSHDIINFNPNEDYKTMLTIIDTVIKGNKLI